MSSGRQPYSTTDIAPYGAGLRRLRPPASLSKPAKAAFVDLVVNMPAGHFEPADVVLMTRWCELSVMCETASGELETSSNMVDADGKPSPWLRVYLDCTKTLSGLALRLRLGPQSRAFKASKKKIATLSYYERMDLENDASESETDN
jgi:phage terminase small subunit